MSADNWGKCPKCVKKAAADLEKAKAKLDSSYGNVPLEQWIRMKENLPSGKVNEFTLREDYEVWVDADGMFYFSYRGVCSVCGFAHNEEIKKSLLK